MVLINCPCVDISVWNYLFYIIVFNFISFTLLFIFYLVYSFIYV